ncbi:MAG: GH3 auxin-responsive promoter family protein [Bacteroidales bacterium]|nr:GH3 auxin-responsive promoter family protein [Bacteroidales bacterium]MCF8391319.1 GH3 auxin-responsive promoter family protein [Bacteroidales bacterium]
MKYPFNVQKETFSKLISFAKNTEWGLKYGYHDEMSIAEFQKSVPIQSYEDIKPFVDRLRSGEQNLTWPSEIKWFAKSSGTTNDKSKFVPVSNEALEDCHFRGGKDTLAIYCNNFPDTNVLKGKALILGGSHQINNFSNQSYYGDLSAILIENMPFWATFIRTPSSKISLIPEWEEKLEKLTEHTIGENVTNISGVPSWGLVFLKYVLEYTGKNNILEVWPNLELFIHGGVSFLPYKDQFQAFIPSPNMRYMETYNASEGFFGIQNDPNSRDMLLMLDYGVFYEFILLEDLEKENPHVYTIADVELNKNYAIIISTNSGLWRYMIGDTIYFTSLSPHKFKISGRTKHFINAFGEEVIVDNAEKALMHACEKTGAIVKEYTAAPVFMDNRAKGSHEWLIEFERAPDDFENFKIILDKSLQELNSDYEAKRYMDMNLIPPKIQSVPQGSFYKWFKSKGKLGGQNKMPRLSNDRKYVEELLAIINS